ncbi:hypothetical protein RB600_002517 [Gaeumannomyces tritici]
MLAVAYPSQAIMLWDMKEDCYFGTCGKKLSNGETSTHVVVTMAFDPNPNIELLVVAYLDGDLALLDLFDDRQIECFRADVQSLAPSPDGRLLAAGGAGGVVHDYEFDTLRPLYRVKSSNSFIKQLNFARDSLRLADIRGSQCTVWEPEALLRDLPADDSSGQQTATSAAVAALTETVSVEADARVTAISIGNITEMPALDSPGLIFCGRDDGTIVLYDRRTATQIRKLHGHKSAVRLMAWCGRRNCLLSVDAWGSIILQHYAGDRVGQTTPTVLFQTRLPSGKVVAGMLVADAAGNFILSTAVADHIFNLEDGRLECDLVPRDGEAALATRKWILDPRAPATHVLCVEESCVRVHAWAGGCAEVARFSLAQLMRPAERDSGAPVTPAHSRNATAYTTGREARILLEFVMQNEPASPLQLALLNLDFEVGQALSRSGKGPDTNHAFGRMKTTVDDTDGKSKAPPAAAPATTVLSLTPIPLADIAHVIGISDTNRLVFLDRCSWVCSADLAASACVGDSRRRRHQAEEDGESDPVPSAPAPAQRHFYIPDVWFAGWGWMSYVSALAQRDIVLTRGGNLAVVRGGLDYAEAAPCD